MKTKIKPETAKTSGSSPPKTEHLTISVATAAGLLGVDVQTVARWIKQKKLRATKINRRVLIRVADIETMLAAHMVQ